MTIEVEGCKTNVEHILMPANVTIGIEPMRHDITVTYLEVTAKYL